MIAPTETHPNEGDLEQAGIPPEQGIAKANPDDEEQDEQQPGGTEKAKRRKRIVLFIAALAVLAAVVVASISARGGEERELEKEGSDDREALANESKLEKEGPDEREVLGNVSDEFLIENQTSNGTAPEAYTNSSLLSAELLDKSIHAVHFSRELYKENVTDIVPGAVAYYDGIDAAIWVKQDGVCYVVFRATTPSVRDWFSNIPLLPPISFQSPSGPWCRTQRGFFNSYFKTSYAEELRNATELCVQSCQDKLCELVVTGGSQGGAIAALAAVDMQHLNPLLITFGQPKTLFDLPGEEPCQKALNTSRYLRFLNSKPGRRNRIPGIRRKRNETVLKYDVVPQITALISEEGEDDLGQLLILGDENDASSQSSLVHYPNGERQRVPMELWDFPCHIMILYRKRLRALQRKITSLGVGAPGVSLAGWADGAVCSFDTECQSNSVCHHNVCVDQDTIEEEQTTLPPDELACEGACRDKLPDGDLCSQHSHCQSGYCYIVCQSHQSLPR